MRSIFRFQVLVVFAAVAQLTVVLVAGDAQVSPEVGTRLPLPLTIKVIDAQGLRFGVLPGAVGGGRIIARGAPVPPGFTLSVLRTK